jgi:hypothetical protein
MTTSPVKDIAPMTSARLLGNRGLPEWDIEEDAEGLDDIEMGEIESSRTEDTESTSDSSNLTEASHSTTGEEKSKPDRRQQFRNQKSQQIRNSGLEELTEKQRHLYHIVDAISSAVLITVVRFSSLMTTLAIRALPFASQYQNTSFEIDDEQWRNAWVNCLIFIGAVVVVLLGTALYLKKGAQLGELTLNRVISYMFRDAYGFFFFWFCVTVHMSLAIQMQHYGADFSMSFDWLKCREPGLMEWPGCLTSGL